MIVRIFFYLLAILTMASFSFLYGKGVKYYELVIDFGGDEKHIFATYTDKKFCEKYKNNLKQEKVKAYCKERKL
jgi:hypothetical protein